MQRLSTEFLNELRLFKLAPVAEINYATKLSHHWTYHIRTQRHSTGRDEKNEPENLQKRSLESFNVKLPPLTVPPPNKQDKMGTIPRPQKVFDGSWLTHVIEA